MKDINFTYPNGFKKALTFSYDDGVYQDLRLTDIFNRYGLKATFNVNSGIEANTSFTIGGKNIFRVDLKRTKEFYENHEIAVHTLNHPDLTQLDNDTIKKEILDDKNNLELIYNRKITGMAFPYGTYNDKIINIMKNIGIVYSRTVEETEKFDVPNNFFTWNPTCHHGNLNLMKLANDFINKPSNKLELFYIWGHSYEFDIDDNWKVINDLAKYVSKKEYIWYATNIEIYKYINSLKEVIIDSDKKLIFNKSNLDVYVEIEGKVVVIKAQSELVI